MSLVLNSKFKLGRETREGNTGHCFMMVKRLHTEVFVYSTVQSLCQLKLRELLPLLMGKQKDKS